MEIIPSECGNSRIFLKSIPRKILMVVNVLDLQIVTTEISIEF